MVFAKEIITMPSGYDYSKEISSSDKSLKSLSKIAEDAASAHLDGIITKMTYERGFGIGSIVEMDLKLKRVKLEITSCRKSLDDSDDYDGHYFFGVPVDSIKTKREFKIKEDAVLVLL